MYASTVEATQGAPQNKRQAYVKRFQDLRSQRSSFDSPWREIAYYVKPRRSRFFTHERTSAGQKKEFNIINNSPTRAVDVNAAGMQAGITSPSRPWFRLSIDDKDLAELGPVKTWLGHVTDRMRSVMQSSNLYDKLHELYVDIGTFCTSVLHIEEHARDVICAFVFPIGSYVLAAGADGRINTVMRTWQMTVAQLVEEFGIENVSVRVRSAYQRKSLDEWIEVLHVVEPNGDYVEGRMGKQGKRWNSCWLEMALPEGENQFLREAGFHEQPFAAPRYSTTGEDVYGTGPGHDAIGDCKTLQLLERKALQLAEKLADPPMVGPSSMRDEPVDLEPGGVNYEDPAAVGRGFRPAVEHHPNAVQVIDAMIQRVERRIDKTMHVDVWLMISQLEQEKTATETLELKAEKMLQMGPMLERFQHEALRIIIERVFGIMLRRGLVPPPPQELQGQDLNVVYESVLAQAQKLAGIQGVQELTKFATSLAAANPDALDNLNEDKAIQEYAQMLGVDPDLLRSDEEMTARRQQRAAAQAKAAQMQQAQAMAETAKTASQADTKGNNALTRMMSANGIPSA